MKKAIQIGCDNCGKSWALGFDTSDMMADYYDALATRQLGEHHHMCGGGQRQWRQDWESEDAWCNGELPAARVPVHFDSAKVAREMLAARPKWRHTPAEGKARAGLWCFLSEVESPRAKGDVACLAPVPLGPREVGDPIVISWEEFSRDWREGR